jgi:hypothetical protein
VWVNKEIFLYEEEKKKGKSEKKHYLIYIKISLSGLRIKKKERQGLDDQSSVDCMFLGQPGEAVLHF